MSADEWCSTTNADVVKTKQKTKQYVEREEARSRRRGEEQKIYIKLIPSDPDV